MHDRSVEVDWSFANQIPYDFTVYEIAGPMTLDEQNNAIKKIAYHEIPGRNGVTLNVIKALNDNDRIVLLRLVYELMDDPNLQ